MARTLSVETIGSAEAGGPADLDGRIVDDQESLRQRVTQKLRFRLGEWLLNPSAGTPSALGRNITPRLAEQLIRDAILSEAPDEITSVTVSADLDRGRRRLLFTAQVQTIYSETPLRFDSEDD